MLKLSIAKLGPQVDFFHYFHVSASKLPNNWSFTFYKTLEIFRTGEIMLQLPIFPDLTCLTSKCCTAMQIQSSYNLKRDFTTVYFLYLSGSLKLCITKKESICCTFWTFLLGSLGFYILLQVFVIYIYEMVYFNISIVVYDII